MRIAHLSVMALTAATVFIAGTSAITAQPGGGRAAPLRPLSERDLRAAHGSGCQLSFDVGRNWLVYVIGNEFMIRTSAGRTVCRITDRQFAALSDGGTQMCGGYRITIDDPLFRSLLTVRVLQMPLMLYFALFMVAVAWFIERHTVIGRNIYAVGGGEDLAKASGLNTERVRIIGFALAGVFYALGSLLAVARVGIADGQSGSNLMFTSITAVVVGGTSLMGGTGGVLNTLVGVLIVASIMNGMVVVGLPSYIQSGVLGVMVIIAVALSINRKAVSLVK